MGEKQRNSKSYKKRSTESKQAVKEIDANLSKQKLSAKIQTQSPENSKLAQRVTDANKEVPTTDKLEKKESQNNTNGEKFQPQNWFLRFAKMWRAMLLSFATIVVTNIVTTLQGQPEQIADFIKQHRTASVFIGCFLLIVSFMALIPLLPEPGINSKQPSNQSGLSIKMFRGRIFSTIVPITSFSLFFLLLSVVVIRPSWCPNFVCPAPRIAYVANGIHDSDIELFPITIQSASFVIPGNPSQYSSNNPPEKISALLIRDQIASAPYRVVVGVHNLHQTGSHVLIERVELVVQNLPPISFHPLNVWIKGSLVDYSDTPYLATYTGENPGEVITAFSRLPPHESVQLAPGESQQLDVQVTSKVVADLIFQIKVTYSIENISHSLLLPMKYEIIFSTQANWNVYQLLYGHFVQKR